MFKLHHFLDFNLNGNLLLFSHIHSVTWTSCIDIDYDYCKSGLISGEKNVDSPPKTGDRLQVKSTKATSCIEQFKC